MVQEGFCCSLDTVSIGERDTCRVRRVLTVDMSMPGAAETGRGLRLSDEPLSLCRGRAGRAGGKDAACDGFVSERATVVGLGER